VKRENLTLRALNRATLSRQGLLARAHMSPEEMIARLAGMQAQSARAPFVGLWSRLAGFRREDLSRLIAEGAVVKATLMRATLHLATAQDYFWMRPAVQPALTAAAAQIARTRKTAEFDRAAVLAAARDYLAAAPRTYAELTQMLSSRFPDKDAGALRYAVRTHLPLIQVPTDAPWCYPGKPAWTPAQSWLGAPVSTQATTEDAQNLILRYLAAFGPATVNDFETWSRLSATRATFDALRPRLLTYSGPAGEELFDVPVDAVPGAKVPPLPDPQTRAGPRFLPEFDNLLLSHRKRERFVPPAHRKKVFLPGLRVAPTVLVDGFVAATWKTEVKRGEATLTVEPFDSLELDSRRAVEAEAEALVRFAEPRAKKVHIAVH